MQSTNAAAFFDLDKTVIAKASMVAFGRPFYRAGLLPRTVLIRALWSQLVYQRMGASAQRIERMRHVVLRITKGWDQAIVQQVVSESLHDVIDPIVYDEALQLIRWHQSEGRKVFIVSASTEEIVAPLGGYLGVDEIIATRAQVDTDGKYVGDIEIYAYGPNKALLMKQAAERDGIDLEASYAYSDSATDLPMLETVGHPVVVNGDRELLRVARQRGWEEQVFTHQVRLRDRVHMPTPKQTVAIGSSVFGFASVAVGAWIWVQKSKGPAVRS